MCQKAGMRGGPNASEKILSCTKKKGSAEQKQTCKSGYLELMKWRNKERCLSAPSNTCLGASTSSSFISPVLLLSFPTLACLRLLSSAQFPLMRPEHPRLVCAVQELVSQQALGSKCGAEAECQQRKSPQTFLYQDG